MDKNVENFAKTVRKVVEMAVKLFWSVVPKLLKIKENRLKYCKNH